MERLTRKCKDTKDGKYADYVAGEFIGIYLDCTYGRVIQRLATIENILGDEYDLDHLRELLQAMSDGELAAFMQEPFCDKRTHEECQISYCGICDQCILDWLQQPAEEAT